jgi:nicotinamidase-related amidase
MTGLSADTTVLLVVDFQSRLMPVIQDAGPVVANANRLLQGARILGLPAVVTEQNAEGLGSTMADLAVGAECVMVPKRTFSACHAPGFMAALRDRPNVVVAGCETHVCVLQTVLGLLDAGRRVYAVRDAMGSRRAESKETALRRMERRGAEIVTAEMVLFELLHSVDHPRFRDVLALIK